MILPQLDLASLGTSPLELARYVEREEARRVSPSPRRVIRTMVRDRFARLSISLAPGAATSGGVGSESSCTSSSR